VLNETKIMVSLDKIKFQFRCFKHMKASFYFILLVFTLLIFSNSCIDAPSFADIPEISNPRIIISGDAIVTGGTSTDSAILIFDFKDGDGDIGYVSGDTTVEIPSHVYLYREELDFTDSVNFKIPFIPQSGGVPDITGTVYITITNSSFLGPCLSPSRFETANFDISIKDRAGNRSNVINFQTIPVICP
jgi:hypothetical protein